MYIQFWKTFGKGLVFFNTHFFFISNSIFELSLELLSTISKITEKSMVPPLQMCLNDFLDWDLSLYAKIFSWQWIFLQKLLNFLANFRLSPKNGVAYKKKCVCKVGQTGKISPPSTWLLPKFSLYEEVSKQEISSNDLGSSWSIWSHRRAATACRLSRLDIDCSAHCWWLASQPGTFAPSSFSAGNSHTNSHKFGELPCLRESFLNVFRPVRSRLGIS